MANPNQVTMITHEQRVRKDHPYRKFLEMIDFRKLCASIQKGGVESFSIFSTNLPLKSNKGYYWIQFNQILQPQNRG